MFSSIYNPFKFFSPLDGKVPEYFSDDFEYIVAKARIILKGRTRKQIEFGWKTVNWILFEVENDITQNLKQFYKADKHNPLRPKESPAIESYFSPATDLLDSICKYDISSQHEFPNAIQAEYFAILALGIIDMICEALTYRKPELATKEKETKSQHPHAIDTFAFSSMEAISFAEIFYLNKTDESANIKAKKLISLKNSAAAIKRHGPSNEIKVKFIHFYNSDKFPSIAEAIRRFYKTLSDKEKSLLNPDAKERDRFFRRALKDSQAENNEN